MRIKTNLTLLLIAAFLVGCAGAFRGTAATVPTSVTADNLTGSPVRNAAGEWLGSVETVVLDTETGHVNYIILSLEDYRQGKLALTGVKKLVPIPWEFFSVARNGWALTLNIRDDDLLYSAPSFKTLPHTDPEGWDAEVQTFWVGREPAAN